MHETFDESELQRSLAAEGIELLYEMFGGLLLRTMSARFGVPADDADSLVHDVFIAYLSARGGVTDTKGWLIATACQSAMAWRNVHPMPESGRSGNDATAEELNALREVLMLQEAIALLPERARAAVRLRLTMHMSYADIATELDMSQYYAKAAVKKAVAKLRSLRRDSSRRKP